MRNPTLPVLAALALTPALALAQPATQPAVSAEPALAGGSATTQPTPASASKPVAPPPGVAPEQITPVAGDAAANARRPLAKVLADADKPDYLDNEGPDPDRPPVPLSAQRAYAAGRQAWRENRQFEAIRRLQTAARLAPKEAAILRLLGTIYTDARNPIRGAFYLEQAVELDATHVPTLILLAKHKLEQQKWDEGVALLDHARTLLKKDGTANPAIGPLIDYFLAAALRRMGHLAAAADRYTAYLEAEDRGSPFTRFGRELLFLDQQRQQTWQTVGDIRLQLEQPDRAAAAYARAVESAQGRPSTELLLRRAYASLLNGDRDAVREMVVARLADAESDDALLPLLRYAVEHGVTDAKLTQRLRQIYEDQGKPIAIALALADLLPPDEARALLTDHLGEGDANQELFEQVVASWLGRGSGKPDLATLAGAVRFTAAAMAAAPPQAGDFARLLLKRVGDRGALLDAIATLPPDERDRDPMVLVLRGLAHAAVSQLDEATARFDDALTVTPDLDVAQFELAKIYLFRRLLDQAQQTIEGVDAHTEGVVILDSQIRLAAQKPDAALRVLDAGINRLGLTTPLALAKSSVLQREGRIDDAKAVLEEALNRRQEDESVYAALFELFDAHPRKYPEEYRDLMRQMLQTIPRSRIARLRLADLYRSRREWDKAEQLLRQQLALDADDPQAIQQLLIVFALSDRAADAERLIRDRLRASPDDRNTLEVASEYFRAIERYDRAAEMLERLSELDPPNFTRIIRLAVLYGQANRPADKLRVLNEALEQGEGVDDPSVLASEVARTLVDQGRPQDAADRLAELRKQYPEDAGDLGYEHAMVLDRMGREKDAQRVMLETLEADPGHPATNNGLGYQWAVDNKNLPRAKAMITKAVEADPESAAYLDSMGWVLYKLGDFRGAVDWLEKSRSSDGGEYPVILDHLGDAYFRLGRKAQAREAWRDAQGLLAELPADAKALDKELADLDDRLNAKLRALELNQVAPVAEVPGAAAMQPEDPADPADVADAGDDEGDEPEPEPVAMEPMELPQAPRGAIDPATLSPEVRGQLEQAQAKLVEARAKFRDASRDRRRALAEAIQAAGDDADAKADAMQAYRADLAKMQADLDAATAEHLQGVLDLIEQGNHDTPEEAVTLLKSQVHYAEQMRKWRLQSVGESR